jgi:uncharacterized repeat protein (TIGR02543 family)
VQSKYDHLANVTLTALPSAGYIFESWSGHTDGINDVSQNPIIFRMGDRLDDDRVITANFAPSDLHHKVSVFTTPEVGGSVSLQPAQPAEGHRINESVSVFAVANPGYVFSRWSGAIAGSDNPRSIRVSEDKSITAIFNPTITIYCSPSQGGSVSLQPESPNGYDAGTKVTLSARSAKGYRFVGWDGDLAGSSKSVTITVDQAKTITARFAEESSSRWWLWAMIGVGGLFGALVLVRLAYARMSRAALEERGQYDD